MFGSPRITVLRNPRWVWLRSFRPFPVEEIIDVAKRYGKIIVLDRGYSIGSDAPLVAEVRNVLYKARSDTPVLSLQIGLGGEEVPHTNIEKLVLMLKEEDM